MQEQERWIGAFSACLLALWPRLEPEDGEHVGAALWHESQWRDLDPDDAAVRWALRSAQAWPAGYPKASVPLKNRGGAPQGRHPDLAPR